MSKPRAKPQEGFAPKSARDPETERLIQMWLAAQYDGGSDRHNNGPKREAPAEAARAAGRHRKGHATLSLVAGFENDLLSIGNDAVIRRRREKCPGIIVRVLLGRLCRWRLHAIGARRRRISLPLSKSNTGPSAGPSCGPLGSWNNSAMLHDSISIRGERA